MPDFQGSVLGALLTLLGWDGTDFQNVKTDSDGHLQVDVLGVADLSTALESVDTDGLIAYIAKFSGSWTALSLDAGSRLMVAVDVAALPSDAATETSLQGVEDRIGALSTPAAESVNWQLNKILTQVTTPSLPSDAATETSLQGIEDAVPDQLIGYVDIYRERVINANAAAGTNIVAGTDVPANELYIIKNIAIFNATNNMTISMLYRSAGGSTYGLVRVPTLVKDTMLSWQGMLVLKEGESIRGLFSGCTLNDDLYLDVQGWKASI